MPLGLVEQAQELDRQARFHKLESARHRRCARECRERQAALEAECRRLGIEVTYSNQPSAVSRPRELITES